MRVRVDTVNLVRRWNRLWTILMTVDGEKRDAMMNITGMICEILFSFFFFFDEGNTGLDRIKGDLKLKFNLRRHRDNFKF